MEEFYKFAAEHYIILIIMALIVGETLIGIFHGESD